MLFGQRLAYLWRDCWQWVSTSYTFIYVLPYSFCIRLGMIAISLSVIKHHCLPDYLYKSSGSAFLSGDKLYYPFAWTHLQSCVPRGIRRPASADGLDIFFRVLSILSTQLQRDPIPMYGQAAMHFGAYVSWLTALLGSRRW